MTPETDDYLMDDAGDFDGGQISPAPFLASIYYLVPQFIGKWALTIWDTEKFSLASI